MKKTIGILSHRPAMADFYAGIFRELLGDTVGIVTGAAEDGSVRRGKERSHLPRHLFPAVIRPKSQGKIHQSLYIRWLHLPYHGFISEYPSGRIHPRARGCR